MKQIKFFILLLCGVTLSIFLSSLATPICLYEGEMHRHQECSKYYVCHFEKPIEQECPRSLHFNPSINACDYPHNAKCDEGGGSSGGSGSNYNICYSRSKVKVGYTYYDCGSCKKVYDEQALGAYSKCFY